MMVSGIYYPIAVMPLWLQYVAKVSPLTYALSGMRQAILENATVSEQERKISGVYKTIDGQRIICFNPITEEELIAYHRQPDTFFGVPLQQGKKVKDPLDLFDFFYESYKECPREKLLEWFKESPDIEALKALDQSELVITCCERWVWSEFRQQTALPCIEEVKSGDSVK